MAIDPQIADNYRAFGIKIIACAITDLTRRSKNNERYQAAFRWVSDRTTMSRLPFDDLCELLGYNSQALREEMIKDPRLSKKLSAEEINILLRDHPKALR